MKLTVDGKTYEFHEDRLTNVEGMAIEKATQMTFGEWTDALNARSMLAITALVWIIQKRDEPTTKFEDVEFTVASLDFEEDETETEEGKAVPSEGEPASS